MIPSLGSCWKYITNKHLPSFCLELNTTSFDQEIVTSFFDSLFLRIFIGSSRMFSFCPSWDVWHSISSTLYLLLFTLLDLCKANWNTLCWPWGQEIPDIHSLLCWGKRGETVEKCEKRTLEKCQKHTWAICRLSLVIDRPQWPERFPWVNLHFSFPLHPTAGKLL